MSEPTYLLGIDNGGTVTKAALYDTAGRELAVSGVKTEMLFPHPGYAEKDLGALWRANVQVIRDVLCKARIRAEAIAALAVTGHGNGVYLVDEKGNPVYNGINSADSRASSYVESWYRDGTFARVLPRTCQSIWAAQPVALLSWFQDRMPEVIEKTRWVFMCKDYIRFRRTGEPFAEITDYSGTGLVNVHDMRYDGDLLQTFGIPDIMGKLPPLRKSADICGRISRRAAEETGLREGTPVAGGLFDIDACAIATGITDTTRLCLIAGSWSINECISTAPPQSDTLFMTSVYCLPGFWLLTEGSATSASNLEWVIAELMRGEVQEARAQGISIYAVCDTLVEEAGGPEKSDIVFLPFLYGSNAGPNASSCFLGMRGWHTKAHLLRAVFEGVVFSHRTHVERLLPLAEKPRAARMAGGAVKSTPWVQMFADILHLPLEATATEELGAMGAAICAGVGAGIFESYPEAVAAMVRVNRTVCPDPGRGQIYDEKYARYRRFVGALQEAWS